MSESANPKAIDATSGDSPSSSRPVRILAVDDSARDAELMISIVRSEGLSVTFDHVDLPQSMRQRLADTDYDVILCDHNLQSWVGTDALEILQRSSKDIPFIIVTGTLGDERAVEYLKQGATDYVLKEHLERLPSAIDRALREKDQRTESARLQGAIRASKEDWERTFDAIPDSIMLLDRECRIVRANQAAVELSGIEYRDIIGKECFTVIHKSSCQPSECPFHRMLLSGREEESEITEGKLNRVLHVSAVPLRDADGSLQGAVHVMRDITERKRLEQELLQSQKMEAIGRLAGGVAHDLNNILGIIVGYGDLIQERVPEANSEILRQVCEIRKVADRARGVTRQLLAFSRKQVMQLKAVKLNEVVTDVAKMLRSLIVENIELTIKSADDIDLVKVDPIQIQQVLMNLVINARDAMPNGGQISILTGNVELDEHYPRFQQPVPAGNYVMIAVNDTGIGMDEETVSHIFEPFFTTKEKGKGTGFGLSIVYGIVKQSGGYVWVYSEPGHGTTFKLYFPRIAGERSNVVPMAPAIAAKAASATILVVEDDEALAEMVCAVLENSGHTVLQAPSGEEALRLTRGYQGPIDLMLSDIMMKGNMDGLELARRFSKLRPDTTLLFMSGYSDALNRAGADTSTKLLEKPFTNAELRERVREALDRRPQTHDPVPVQASSPSEHSGSRFSRQCGTLGVNYGQKYRSTSDRLPSRRA